MHGDCLCSSVLADLVPFLECPVCTRPLALVDRALRCTTGHSFDVARQGYVTLLPPGGQLDTGDSAAMVAARDAFLTAGHYRPLRTAVVDAVRDAGAPPGLVADLGGGTGWYLAGLLDAFGDRMGVCLDNSKPALRRAARAHGRSAAVACDAWQRLPLRTGAAAVLINVFAPRNGPEIERVVGPGGVVVVATPTPRHLQELVGPLGLLTVGSDKDRRVHETLGGSFAP